MSAETWRSVDGTNRKIKEMYRSVSGANRKAKELYRSAGGANRKVFSGDVICAVTTGGSYAGNQVSVSGNSLNIWDSTSSATNAVLKIIFTFSENLTFGAAGTKIVSAHGISSGNGNVEMRFTNNASAVTYSQYASGTTPETHTFTFTSQFSGNVVVMEAIDSTTSKPSIFYRGDLLGSSGITFYPAEYPNGLYLAFNNLPAQQNAAVNFTSTMTNL